MVTTNWCKQQGMRLITPNNNLARSYLDMAKASIEEQSRLQTDIWKVTTSYYIFYYSLYAVLMHVGVKSTIHACSLLFMKGYLPYSEEDNNNIAIAFQARIDLQYYAERTIDKHAVDHIMKTCVHFYTKSKELIATITHKERENRRTRYERTQK